MEGTEDEVKYLKSSVEALDYIEIIRSEKKLLGGYGDTISKQRLEHGEVKVLKDRKLTAKLIENGEIHLKETPLGACISPAPCHKLLHIPLTGCLHNCSRAMLIPHKMLDASKKTKLYIDTLQEGPEKNTAEAELSELLSFMKNNGIS